MSAYTSARPDNDSRQFAEKIRILESKLATKTEALLRVGKDLESVENERTSWQAEAANYERNLHRTEKELEKTREENERLRKTKAEEITHLDEKLSKVELRYKAAQEEIAYLRSELKEQQKDCKVYRQKLAKLEVARMESEEDVFEAAKISNRTSRDSKSGTSLDKYEKLRHEHGQLEADFQTLLNLKEECVQEKDVLIRKVEGLQTELSYLLNGDSRRVAEDVHDLLAENRFLKAQLDSAQEESDSMKASLSKYRTMAEESNRKKRVKEVEKEEQKEGNGRPRIPSDNEPIGEKSSVAVINMKQIREMLASQAIELNENDYRAISTILLDLCNDKQMALAHQRKANKILGSRLAEVEAKLLRVELQKSPRSTNPYLSAEQARTPDHSTRSVLPDDKGIL